MNDFEMKYKGSELQALVEGSASSLFYAGTIEAAYSIPGINGAQVTVSQAFRTKYGIGENKEVFYIVDKRTIAGDDSNEVYIYPSDYEGCYFVMGDFDGNDAIFGLGATKGDWVVVQGREWVKIATQQREIAGIEKLESQLNEATKEIDRVDNMLLGAAVENTMTSDKRRIGLWIDHTLNVHAYRLRITCTNPPVDSFSIYKSTELHTELELINSDVSFGSWVEISRDEKKPVLYIYTTKIVDETIAEVAYNIELACDSLIDEVKSLSEEANLISGEVEIPIDDRLSMGIPCPTGKIVVRLALGNGSDKSDWIIYRYTNKAFNSQVLATDLTLGDCVEVEVPEGDTGIWLFTSNTDASVRTYSYAIGKALAGEVVKVKKVNDSAAMQGYLAIPFNISELIAGNGDFELSEDWKRTDFFPVIAGTRVSCYETDSVKGLFFYSKNKFPLGYMPFPTVGYHDLIIKLEDIPIGAYYAVACGYENAHYRVWIPMKQIATQGLISAKELTNQLQDIISVTGKIYEYSLISTINQIKIHIDDTPLRDEYFIQIDCDNPPVEKFSIYKCYEGHSGYQLIGDVTWGKPFKVTRDPEKPSLYLFAPNGTSDTVEAYQVKISFKTTSSIVDDINAVVGNNSWKNKTIVCFGDSITEFQDYDNNKAYADYIQDITGAKVYNIGIGGTQFRQRTIPVDIPTTTLQAYAALDIINMVRACCEQEFSKQIAATNYLTTNNIDANDAIIARAQSIDWSKVDVVTIFAGTNDWNNASNSWGESTVNNTDVNTTFGAMNEIIKMLLTTYPHLVIYWFTPTVRWLTNDAGEKTSETFSDNFTKNDNTLKDFSAKIEDVVKKHHLPVCDMYNTLGWNQYNFSQYFSDSDGTHPRKGKGVEQIARKIIAFINANRTF